MRRARLLRSPLALVLGTLACFAWGCAGGSEDGDGPTGPSPAPREVWNIHFGTPGNGLDLSPCVASVAGGFCGQPIRVDANGAFSEVWSESTPNTLRADGTLTATALSAVLACVNTSATGTMSASRSGSEYTGTATLGGRSVSIRVLQDSPGC